MDATRQIMGQIKKGQSIGIVIGPEGGFTPEEIKLADDNDMHRISLGRRILQHGDSRSCHTCYACF